MATKIYNLTEAAEIAGVGRLTLSRYIRRGLLKSHVRTLPTGKVRHRITHEALVECFGVLPEDEDALRSA
jgi:predicted site-specific integrase-resolvase